MLSKACLLLVVETLLNSLAGLKCWMVAKLFFLPLLIAILIIILYFTLAFSGMCCKQVLVFFILLDFTLPTDSL